jgi:flagellar biosynthesis/type III secretory pathway chaperone
MSMDKLINELLNLLCDLLAGQGRLLALATARRDAMKTFDIARLEALTEQQRVETQALAILDVRRKALVAQFKPLLKGAEPTVSEIARRVGEPQKTQLLALAGQIKATVEQLDRANRINATVSEAVIKGLAKVLKIVTGLAQHAGLYMRNGRKAALHGIHLLEITA